MEWTLTLNQEELKGLIKIFDVAVRANGLAIAEDVLYFKKKIEDGFVKEQGVRTEPSLVRVESNGSEN